MNKNLVNKMDTFFKSMPNYKMLCEIAVVCQDIDIDIDESFEYKQKMWKPFDRFKKTEIIYILDFLNIYKRSGFAIISHEESLYFIHEGETIRGKDQFYAQKNIFPIIFKNYIPESDLSVAVGIKVLGQQECLKTIQKFVAKKLYEALFVVHKKYENYVDETEEVLDLPPNFLPKLCHYQVRTVRWLLSHENRRTIFPQLFKQLDAKDGTKVYKNMLCTQFENEKQEDVPLAPGGILAEEMGLGKTVEMLALILLHKREKIDFRLPGIIHNRPLKRGKEHLFCICTKSQRNKIIQCNLCHIWQHEKCVNHKREQNSVDIYICPNCWKSNTENNLIQSAATIIITPNTLKRQWVDEIKRHISPSSLRFFVYEGISNGDWISPRQLADYDIVLTDYNILRREVFHTSAHDSDRVLRHKPRSMRLYTPLLMINWFRVCLDEAQMVESDTSQMAALVRIIPAINRWAVTGTPIQSSIDDLYPLIRFMGLENILNAASWETLVRDFMLHCDDGSIEDRSSLLLVEILRDFMWRTCKEQVLDELPIPPQTELIYHVTLSDLERLFYTEQHEECELKFNEAVNKYIKRNNSIINTSQNVMKSIMKPLLKIRQCCTIPVVISTNRPTATGVLQNQFLHRRELHAHLKLTNEKACKHELRSMASSYNGSAAIHFIKGNYREAVKNYESVLKLAKEYASEKNISVDSLLQIHALYNILEARNTSPELALEISQDKLNEYEHQLNALEWKYLETYASELRQMEMAFKSSLQTLKTNIDILNEDLLDFLSILLEIDDINLQNQIIAKILDECSRKFGNMRLEAASSLRGVLFMIVSWNDKIMKVYKKILKSLEELNFYTSNIKPRSQVNIQTWREMSKFINTVYACHLMDLRNLKNNSEDEEQELQLNRTISRKRKRKHQNICKLCKLRDLLNNFECMLFKKSIDLLTNNVEGDENPQLEIEIIKIIFTFLKPKRPELASDMDKHYQVLQNMQNFCKKAMKYWIEIEFSVKAFDELDMCKMRIGLTEEDDEKSIYKIRSYELDMTFAEQQNNLQEAQQNFVQKLARLKYIKHLESNADVGPCPICQSEDEVRHIVLECGHQLCLPCFKNLCQYNAGCNLTCSICRNVQNTKRVYFVTCLPNKNKEQTPIKVIGDFSSKINFIVQLVLKLQQDHVNKINNTSSESHEEYPLKILLFSQWISILHALAKAFEQNNISYLLNLNVRTIENFKNPSMGITCLLMPLSKGCKGLNLIEATHVFLVEPVLNPSEEDQAIGRVHRFGQTRPTTVHRFIVDGTIEENIYNVVAGKESQKQWDFDNLKFESLCELFKLHNNVTANFTNSINEISTTP